MSTILVCPGELQAAREKGQALDAAATVLAEECGKLRTRVKELEAALEITHQELQEAADKANDFEAECRDMQAGLRAARQAMAPYESARELNFVEKMAMASVLGLPNEAGDRVLVLFKSAEALKGQS